MNTQKKDKQHQEKQQREGKVITRYGAEFLVEINTNNEKEIIRCTAKRKFDHVACGDNVTIELAQHGNARLIAIATRKNALTRPDYSHKLKTIAANIDQIVIIMSWRPEPFWELLDRYLVTANLLNAKALIVMNKNDLADQYASDEKLTKLNEYPQAGYSVINTTAEDSSASKKKDSDNNSDNNEKAQKNKRELTDLKRCLDENVNVLVGQSGVGKSSLAALLLPETDIVVGDISHSGEGKHTTTTTTLYRLPSGGSLIDSPGVRDFTLPEMTAQQLREGYQEFSAYSPLCKFNNCSHDHEPNCKVREAVENGELPKNRYHRYLKLSTSI